MGGGCGSVGRAVVSDTRGPWFESSHRIFIEHLFTVNCVETMKINLKRGREWAIEKTNDIGSCFRKNAWTKTARFQVKT